METLVERIILKLKDNKLIACLIVAGIIIIGVGAVISALDNIWKFTGSVSQKVPTKIDTFELRNSKKSKEIEEKKQQITALIESAAVDVREFRLTTPKENNAYQKYLSILKLDRDNQLAQNGIEKIITIYASALSIFNGRI